MHFCVLAARLGCGGANPRKIGLNWFIPALVNSSVGSSCGTTGEDGTNAWPCFLQKKSMNCWRISEEGIIRPLDSSGKAAPAAARGRPATEAFGATGAARGGPEAATEAGVTDREVI